jgi:hypothetical protein
MLVGFIAVIVILLVIIGVMSTGATSGSGGVDQTKATKLISEISGIAQSVGFYKTLTKNGDYKDMNTTKLAEAGIVELDKADANPKKHSETVGSITPAGSAKYVKSKAIEGVYYDINVKDNTNDVTHFTIDVMVDGTKVSTASEGLGKAMEKAMTKFGTFKDKAADNPDVAQGIDHEDGIAQIKFK